MNIVKHNLQLKTKDYGCGDIVIYNMKAVLKLGKMWSLAAATKKGTNPGSIFY